jgi:DNA topoisomerase-1
MRQSFNAEKIRNGIIKACEKRPVPVSVIDEIVADISKQVYNSMESEITTKEIGEMVMDRLKKADEVSYVRYASVYRSFKDLSSFMAELKQMMKAEKQAEKQAKKAEKEMDGQKVKVPDVMTDEICELCGKPMVIKSGRYGKFMACSGFPECTNTKKIVKYTPGVCPKCGGRILQLNSKKGRVFYACENGTDCGFMSWEEPTDKKCEVCGSTMFKKSAKGAQPHCIKEGCPNASVAPAAIRSGLVT